MKKQWGLILTFILTIYFCFSSINLFAEQGGSKMKKAVMIIAQNDFREEELFQPKEIMEKTGIEVQIACSSLNIARGTKGQTFKPQLQIKDLNVKDFDAVIFVGGAGAIQYWDNPLAHKIAQDAYANSKVIAAICSAPVVLAKAGILNGKRSTVWASYSQELISAGAKYFQNNVEKDGKIITASGPFAAKEFGEELVKAIKSAE